jgi:hypothetical protein
MAFLVPSVGHQMKASAREGPSLYERILGHRRLRMPDGGHVAKYGAVPLRFLQPERRSAI